MEMGKFGSPQSEVMVVPEKNNSLGKECTATSLQHGTSSTAFSCASTNCRTVIRTPPPPQSSSPSPKLLSVVVCGLRDPDTVVRSACVAATGSIASHITKPPFRSVAKPLVDALVTEQNLNSQIDATLCLATVINGTPDPNTAYLRRLLPRIERLLKNDSFKAKAALLTIVASFQGVFFMQSFVSAFHVKLP
ncbi:hypothetical protein L1887_34630 [Cichorium endivia]|nr:hypothetical protein L1887_34630 [Cichorium endivia]